MSQMFDPYYLWLGIPPDEQPPNFYRLLGVRAFETDADVIDHAAQRAAMHVAGFRAGVHQRNADQILAEIRTAHATLLDREQRPAYDRALYARMQPAPGSAPAPAGPPADIPPPVVVHVPLPPQQPPAPVVVHVPLHSPGPAPVAVPMPMADVRQTGPWPRLGEPMPQVYRREQAGPLAASGFSLPQPVKIVLGGIAGLALGYALVYFLAGEDVLGLLPRRGPPPAVDAPP